MSSNAHQNYLENEVLTADPLELVVLLYEGALDAIACARRESAAGDSLHRAKCISKALSIVWELNRSLDFQRGGELSVRLTELYQYIRGRLIKARQTPSDELLAEVEQLLSTLLDGWRECERGSMPASYSRVEECSTVEYAF